MYFPYLKARSEEANALVKTLCEQNSCDNVIPIIQPCDPEEEEFFPGFRKIVSNLIEHKKKFICLVGNESDLDRIKVEYPEGVFDEYCVYGFTNFFPLDYNFKNGAVIHEEAIEVADNSEIIYHVFMPSVLQSDIFYSQNYPKEKAVYISDAFKKYSTNAEYPPVDTFNNSQLCYRYKEIGIAGFGDFTIMEGEAQVGGGGNQNTITHIIHLTNEGTSNAGNPIIEANHFLTTPVQEPDIASRSIKTLNKAYEKRMDFCRTKGIEIIEDYCQENRSTSLGMYKRIGMMHHICLMDEIIKNN